MSRPLRPLVVCVLLLSSSALVGCDRKDPKLSFSAHLKATIPSSAKLIHSGGQYAGFDASYGFVFDVSDKKLQELLVDEWQLKAASPSESGFFKFAKYTWWPTDDTFLELNESFGRSDDQSEEYWHVWFDRRNGKLYVEHGRW